MYDLPDFERYVQVRPGLFRCTIVWSLGFGIHVPVATFLVKGPANPGSDNGHSWLMIDSGEAAQVPRLLKAVEDVMTHPKDTLKYICITHAHLDHIAASPALLEKYPEAKVVTHEEERPFLCDGRSFRSCTGDTWSFTIFKNFSHECDVRVPHDRILALRDGDEWEFAHLIKFVETPGHTPGSASYIHIPTRSMMVGDAVMNIATNPMLSKIPCVSGPLAISTCHWGNAMKAIDKILTYKDQVDTVFPAHDYNENGVPIDHVRDFHQPQNRL